jgi:hypothetical protein
MKKEARECLLKREMQLYSMRLKLEITKWLKNYFKNKLIPILKKMGGTHYFGQLVTVTKNLSVFS